jgi:hypothetical protein
MLGFIKMMELYHMALKYPQRCISIDFRLIHFFEANMSALLLALIKILECQNSNTCIIEIPTLHEPSEILHRNGFVSHVRSVPHDIKDDRKTTVPLKKFYKTDADAFVNYIEEDFLKHRGLEGIEPHVLSKIKESYLELFANIDLHADTEQPLYACGQFFPRRREFKFTIVDVGVGFLKNFQKIDSSITTSEAAIRCALHGKSTKQEARGGSGLSNILRLCVEQKAEFHVVSGDAYFLFDGQKASFCSIVQPFLGTTIHLVFRF